ncbi:MAG: 30S ribosomal protein S2 [Candidatus Sungiibacteriota bacterium]|uniref:Small ribosomal subunit protein uS2 n=1 Tax=Candidatus Sungiibacteriota bacterium TaxID=2750080 RepID=A0A7T5RJL6_9BACT|nr:MAG: 30S ribosomal protein S2 [Candidatus Sungbacteria bacterium]
MSEITAENNTFAPLPVVDPEIEEMMKAGVHLGHAKTKNHPAMQPYIFGVRNTISLIDLIKTKEKLAAALEFIKDVTAKGGLVLLVGTRPAARKIILEVAEKTKMPYFVERWIGGALTNFKVISKRVEYMETLEKEKATGDFEKYTKKERMKKEEEIVHLKRIFDGLRILKHLPGAVFIVDITHDDTAVREARRMKIPIVALVDTNSNADLVDYHIPSNDDALPAVRYMVGKIGQVIEEGQKMLKEVKKEEPEENK